MSSSREPPAAGGSEGEELPPLKPAEFKVYNSLAERMDAFHEHFRQTWTLLHTACSQNRRPQGMSIRQFIDEGLSFCHYLTTHHNIEERYVFPMLARKMPEFQASGSGSGGGGSAELLQQHREIHRGLDGFEDYLTRCRGGETELELRVMLDKMNSFGAVLWRHLDQEVKTLGAENMRRYWTMDEIRAMPM